MTRVLVLLVVVTFGIGSVLAQQPDPIADATMHAAIDAANYKATDWGGMAFIASILLSPLLGGGGVIVAANVMEPVFEVPANRLLYAQETYQDTAKLLLYQTQYRMSMAPEIRKDRSHRASVGTGVGLLVYLGTAIVVFMVLDQPLFI